MLHPRFALRLLAYGDSLGVREELIGDLQEEIARGRSQLWVCVQLIGVYGFALLTHLRNRARLTPPVVALALSLVLFGVASVASAGPVLAAWLSIYYMTGTLSLFAHMASQTMSGRVRVISEDPEPPSVPS